MAHQLRTEEEQTQSLANYLPGGRLFKSANVYDSNFRKLLRGLAGELVVADGNLRSYEHEIIPDETVQFIDEWEKAVGIPDTCFSGIGSISERRLHVLVKLASLGMQTSDDFVELAAIFGVTVEVLSASVNGDAPTRFPLITFPSAEESYFTIIVVFTVQAANRFPFIFPFPFGDNTIALLECLFRKLKPANCDIIFEQE